MIWSRPFMQYQRTLTPSSNHQSIFLLHIGPSSDSTQLFPCTSGAPKHVSVSCKQNKLNGKVKVSLRWSGSCVWMLNQSKIVKTLFFPWQNRDDDQIPRDYTPLNANQIIIPSTFTINNINVPLMKVISWYQIKKS